VQLSKSGSYALRALIYIAEPGEDGPLRVAEIAAALDVPRNYLSKLLHRLTQAGVLQSGRGPRGGFSLAHRPESLSLRDPITDFLENTTIADLRAQPPIVGR
jgi:Rrf2 family protein